MYARSPSLVESQSKSPHEDLTTVESDICDVLYLHYRLGFVYLNRFKAKLTDASGLPAAPTTSTVCYRGIHCELAQQHKHTLCY